MTKKLLSAALALSLLFLAACRASEPETTGSAESTTSVSATEATTEPVQTEGITLSTQNAPETEPSGATAETSAPETAASETSAPATEPVQHKLRIRRSLRRRIYYRIPRIGRCLYKLRNHLPLRKRRDLYRAFCRS